MEGKSPRETKKKKKKVLKILLSCKGEISKQAI
jgi:hypothetical protein